MPKAKAKATTKKSATGPTVGRDHPEVIIDFDFDHGLLHVAVVNVSDLAAYEVSVDFDQPFRGLGGTQDVSSLPMFRCIEFLAPRKRIETFLDSSSAYFQRREPSRISAVVSYRDVRGRAYKRRIVHDLSIYEDVSYVVPRTSVTAPEYPAEPERVTPLMGRGHHGSHEREAVHELQLSRRSGHGSH
jgi:hypothetical protein